MGRVRGPHRGHPSRYHQQKPQRPPHRETGAPQAHGGEGRGRPPWGGGSSGGTLLLGKAAGRASERRLHPRSHGEEGAGAPGR